MTTIPTFSGKNISSFNHVNGKELYLTLNDYRGLWKLSSGRYLDKTSSPNVDFIICRTENKLNIKRKSTQKNWFSISITTDFNKSVLHKTKPILAVENQQNTLLYNLESKSIIKEFSNETFVKYSFSGEYIFTNNGIKIFITNIDTGAKLDSCPAKSNYALSSKGDYFAYIKNDTISISNILENKTVWKQNFNNPKMLQFFPNTQRLLFLTSDSLCIFDIEKKKIETKVFAEPGIIKMMDIAPNEKSILITTPKAVSVWEINSHFDADTTPFFNLHIPVPHVKPHISFNGQYINSSSEKIFSSIIQNRTAYQIIIDTIFIESDNSCFQLVAHNSSQKIESGRSVDIELRFTPNKTGQISDRLIVVSGLNRFTCTIQGKGIMRDYKILSPTIQFPALTVNSTYDTLIPLITNIGTEPLMINKIDLISIEENNFEMPRLPSPTQLESNDTIWTNNRFKPTTRGRQTAIIKLNIDDNNWIKTTDLYGEGKAKRHLVIAGKTVDFITKKGISSIVTITSLQSNKLAHKFETNRNGEFAIKINTDLNYSITAERTNFFSSSENIDLTTPQTTDTIWTTITLTPIEKNSTIRLNNIFFDSGKAELLDISKTDLLRIVKLLKSNKKLKIEIHGHTDNIGNPKSNETLSVKRANSVRNFIINQKINPQRISVKSYGELNPIESNNTETGRKANRRVEIKFVDS